MLATFCLRLAGGLLLVQYQLPSPEVQPRFFRTQYLIVLGLTALAGIFSGHLFVWVWLGPAMVLAFGGSVVWMLEGAPGSQILRILNLIALFGALVIFDQEPPASWRGIDHLSSAFLMGSALSAMLLGHSYLTAPTMSLTPLLRMLTIMMVVLLVRMLLAGCGLWLWTGETSASNLETETALWLMTRWLVGFFGPFVLGWMAYEAARIRSTQSATGILYVVVAMCFLGELLSLLLLEKTGFIW